MRELKAISQNLMHSNISITDGIYGGLSTLDVKNQIIKINKKSIKLSNITKIELVELLQNILEDNQ